MFDGTDNEKLQYLRAHSNKDYLIAQSFSLPKKWGTNFVFVDSNEEKKVPCVNLNSINAFGGPMILFNEVFNELENQLTFQTTLKIPQDPYVVLTPLKFDDNGNLKPYFTKRMKL